VKWFTDSFAISADEQMKQRRLDEFLDLQETWNDDPQAAANHMVLGMDLNQRKAARGNTKSRIPTWV